LISLVATCLVAGLADPVAAQDDPAIAELQASGEQFVKAFNSGKAAELAGMFLAKGELVDELGNVYQGPKELNELFTKYFEKFPMARLALDIESVRTVGPNLAIEEGTRFIAAGEDARAQLRYTAVRVKGEDGKWQVASIREFTDDPAPTPREQLQPLAWIVGDWVNEGSDAVVKINYKWSEDGNYLLGDYLITSEGKVTMKSSQRIGWDPLTGKVRSWLFDADGGFAEGHWTLVDDGWVIKSSTVNPDGSTGSATITVLPKSQDSFSMKGTERIVGDQREPDFDLTIVRRPPAATK
jgi:uncharacterized protein (TIGR02246 family)